jgi:arylsulfatase A-like enzyme
VVPFFVFLAPYAPHGPAQPAARHADALPGLGAPRTPAFDEADMSDKPPWMRGFPALSETAVARIDERFRRRVLSLLAVDELLGELLRSLEANGQLDSTYVFVTSDNGFHLGSHRKSHGKADPYEEAARVPLFVRGPGVAAGRSVAALTANIDLAPTLAELAGVEPPSFVDGRSLVSLLTAQATPPEWTRDLVVENWARHEESVPHYSALRTTRYMYVEYETGERELYDLEHDPYQLENVAATADSGLVRRLAQRLARLKACAGAACRE